MLKSRTVEDELEGSVTMEIDRRWLYLLIQWAQCGWRYKGGGVEGEQLRRCIDLVAEQHFGDREKVLGAIAANWEANRLERFMSDNHGGVFPLERKEVTIEIKIS